MDEQQGTVFGGNKDEQGDWFSFFNSRFDREIGEIVYDEPEEDAAQFRIRHPGPFWDEQRRGRERKSEVVANKFTRGMERIYSIVPLDPEAEAKENDDSWDYAITGMKDAFWGPGVEIECDRENKLKLIDIPSFARFMQEVFSILSDVGIKQAEGKEENL